MAHRPSPRPNTSSSSRRRLFRASLPSPRTLAAQSPNTMVHASGTCAAYHALFMHACLHACLPAACCIVRVRLGTSLSQELASALALVSARSGSAPTLAHSWRGAQAAPTGSRWAALSVRERDDAGTLHALGPLLSILYPSACSRGFHLPGFCFMSCQSSTTLLSIRAPACRGLTCQRPTAPPSPRMLTAHLTCGACVHACAR